MKRLVAVLALFVVLFAAGTGAGIIGDGEAVDPSEFASLREVFLLHSPVEMDDIDSPCLDEGTLVVGPIPCTAAIAPSGDRLRRLELTLQQGTAAQILFRQPKAVRAREILTQAEPVELDVFEGGGTLTVNCQGGCRIELR